eukprot:gnl/TRDRNA2_/TRDRNA2_158713_c0_seq1.p1 gnl/TRDRNA2_/TRDRNA2_158713_c0~~gnl/TRDRNA2_/TRDRNA2_158713_c0_seq1.p1  ORF type:complete len:302 (+),score=53.62 gnl/TRDRNA2_/TRDRNA2_158713_c0_seq1:120-1025(+)
MMNGPNYNELWYGSPGAKDHLRSLDEIRIIKDMAAQEVEQFLIVNEVDPTAARELRAEPPHVALAVVDGGTLSKCRNPSGALVARIRDARRGIVHSSKGKGASKGGGAFGAPRPILQVGQVLDPNASELDKFLAANGIDQAASNALRAETAEVQKNVMSMGSFATSTNPSASLMARIRTAKAPDFRPGAQNYSPSFPSTPGGAPSFPSAPGTAPQLALPSTSPPSFPGAAPQLSGVPASFPGTSPQMTMPSSSPPAPAPPPPPPPTSQPGGDINDEAAKAIEKLRASLGQPADIEPSENML